jgi:hypothetical protein
MAEQSESSRHTPASFRGDALGGRSRYASCSWVERGRGWALGALLAPEKEDEKMLFALAVVLVVIWGLGFLAFHVTTGMIHLLLLVAVVAIVFQLVSRRTA